MVQALIRSTDRQSDQLQVYANRTWAQFEALQKGYEGTAGVRLSFFEGMIEVLVPGRKHEIFKSVMGNLIELFLFERRIEFTPTGSMTRLVEGVAAAEADESYEIGGYILSIEVTVAHGSISKLALYQQLGVHEVWFWEDGLLAVYHLNAAGPAGYERADRSGIPALAAIDLAILSKCILTGETSRIKAMADFQAAHPLVVNPS
jgi:hypothetical protein